MSVTPELEPGRATVAPGGRCAFVLHLRNAADQPATCTVRAGGDLGAHAVVEPAELTVAPGDVAHVAVEVAVPSTTPPGPSSLALAVSAPGVLPAPGEAETADDDPDAAWKASDHSATATIDVEERAAHRVALRPERSRSSAAGRHQVVAENTGNVPVTVTLDVDVLEGDAAADPATTTLHVEPGATSIAQLRMAPAARFGTGPAHIHRFRVHADGSDGLSDELDGMFEQLPRWRRWHAIAAGAVVGGLLLAALVWFALLRPAIEDIARDEAEEALAAQQALIDERIAELERSAAEAEELPLGTPADLRLDLSVAAGDEGTTDTIVDAGTVLSITDVVLQNPSGAVGTVTLLRDGEVLLESELANFRDLDLHFVAPFRFEPGSELALTVACATPGPGAAECDVGATLLGFADEI